MPFVCQIIEEHVNGETRKTNKNSSNRCTTDDVNVQALERVVSVGKKSKLSTSSASLHNASKKAGVNAPVLPPKDKSITGAVSAVLKTFVDNQNHKARRALQETQSKALEDLKNAKYHLTTRSLQECLYEIDASLSADDLSVEFVETFSHDHIHAMAMALRPIFQQRFVRAFIPEE